LQVNSGVNAIRIHALLARKLFANGHFAAEDSASPWVISPLTLRGKTQPLRQRAVMNLATLQEIKRNALRFNNLHD